MQNNATAATLAVLPATPEGHDDDHGGGDFIEDLVVFQVCAVMLGILCFGANGALMAAALYSRRPRTASRAKTTLFISQAAAGLLSPLSFIYPSQIARLRYTSHPVPTAVEFLTSSSSCWGTSTFPLVISTLSPVTHTLLLILEIYLPLVDCLLAWQHWALLAGLAWFAMLLLALFPAFGWNNWLGLCYLPSAWTSNYSGFLSMLVFLQAMTCAYMLLGIFIRARSGKESLAEEELPPRELSGDVSSWDAKARFAGLLALLLCELPFLLHILVHADVLAPGISPLVQLAWIARHDSALPWSVLISLLASALLPPLTVAADPVLSAALVALSQHATCCRPRYVRTRNPRRRNNAVSPASTDWDRGSPR